MSSQQQQQQQQEGSKTPGDSIRQGSGVLCTYLTLVPFHLLDDSFFISINHVQAPLFFVCVCLLCFVCLLCISDYTDLQRRMDMVIAASRHARLTTYA